MGGKKRQLEGLKRAFDELHSQEVLFQKTARVIKHHQAEGGSSLPWPNVPSIAVQANNESVAAHARVFIAVRYTGAGRRPDPTNPEIQWPKNGIVYKTTDLVEFARHPAAKITFEDARSWAKAGLSKTWQISQPRAENAIAVALQFTRVQSYWAETPSGGYTKEEHEEMRAFHRGFEKVWAKSGWGGPYIGKVTRLNWTGGTTVAKGAPPPPPMSEEMKMKEGDPMMQIDLLGGGKVLLPKSAVDESKGARNPFERDVSYKYGKLASFGESLSPKCWLFGQKREYMTCASYAQILLKAAGVEAPHSLGAQSAWNMIDYEKSLSHVFARLISLGPRLGSDLKGGSKESKDRRG